MEILTVLGKNLRSIREEKGISQEDLAFKSGVSVYYISRIERGKANVGMETLYKILKALGIKLPEWMK